MESEKHVILSCPAYEDLRRKLFIKTFCINSDFYEMSSDAKLSFISQGEKLEYSFEPLKKLVIENIAFLSTLASLETDSG